MLANRRTPFTKPVAAAAVLALVVVVGVVVLLRARNSDSRALTNGCTYTNRGLPSCGAYVGGAYGSNSDIASWEVSAGGALGLHRVFYRADQVDDAVRTAQADAARKRITWMSFKAPHPWAEMARGKGDAWARDLAARLGEVDGPVWLAIHHEPEGEAGADIQEWRAMQARLAPLVRAVAPNVAYTVILMGYPEFSGDPTYALGVIWPDTTVDVAGFDIYERYGVVKDGVGATRWTDFRGDYFDKLQAWADKVGTRWGLAETGYSDPAATANPRWFAQTYDDLVTTGGIAFSYFNSTLNSEAHWALDTKPEKAAFAGINQSAPRID